MKIQRDYYLNKLINRKDNGLIKIITGIRRCGKSYLLFELYDEYLRTNGVAEDHILKLALDDTVNARYRNPIQKYCRKARYGVVNVDRGESVFFFQKMICSREEFYHFKEPLRFL